MNKQAFLEGYLGRPNPQLAFLGGYLSEAGGLDKSAGLLSWIQNLGRKGVNPAFLETLSAKFPKLSVDVIQDALTSGIKQRLKGPDLERYITGTLKTINKDVSAASPGLASKIGIPVASAGAGALGLSLLQKHKAAQDAAAADAEALDGEQYTQENQL